MLKDSEALCSQHITPEVSNLLLTCLQANGEEPPPFEEPQLDIEGQVEAAMAAVQKPAPSEVTDGDVLSALMEQGVVTKETIVHGLAVHMLGDKAHTNQQE